MLQDYKPLLPCIKHLGHLVPVMYCLYVCLSVFLSYLCQGYQTDLVKQQPIPINL